MDKPNDDRPRKTLAELAAEAGGGGLVCSKCGCRHFIVLDTVRGDGFIRRYRECRHCGHRVVTTEKKGLR